MTESTVDRGTRATSSPSTTRTHLRMAWRGLVVAGFAGGIWLLTGSAAHASDGHAGRAPGSTGTLTNLVNGIGGNGVDAILGPVVSAGDPITRVLLPSDATPVVHSAVTTSTTHQVADGAGTGGAVGDLGAVARLLAPVTGAAGDAVARTGITLPKLTPQTAGWRTGGGPRSTGTTVVRHRRSIAVMRTAATTRPVTAGRRATGTCVAASVNSAGTAALPAVVPAPRVNLYRHGYRRHAGGDRPSTRVRYGAEPVGSRHGPEQPEPAAPFGAYPDPGLLPSGAQTASSVSHVPGGGVPAVVPATATGTPEAGRRLVPTAQVGRLPSSAESPTVSPD